VPNPPFAEKVKGYENTAKDSNEEGLVHTKTELTTLALQTEEVEVHIAALKETLSVKEADKQVTVKKLNEVSAFCVSCDSDGGWM
jgi:hypothetical protein